MTIRKWRNVKKKSAAFGAAGEAGRLIFKYPDCKDGTWPQAMRKQRCWFIGSHGGKASVSDDTCGKMSCFRLQLLLRRRRHPCYPESNHCNTSASGPAGSCSLWLSEDVDCTVEPVASTWLFPEHCLGRLRDDVSGDRPSSVTPRDALTSLWPTWA